MTQQTGADTAHTPVDGIRFTESLRALPYNPIVIWMTAYDCCVTRPDAERLRAHRRLDKPLE